MFTGGEVSIVSCFSQVPAKVKIIPGGGYMGKGRYSFAFQAEGKVIVDLQSENIDTTASGQAPTGLSGRWWIGDKEPKENKNKVIAAFSA